MGRNITESVTDTLAVIGAAVLLAALPAVISIPLAVACIAVYGVRTVNEIRRHIAISCATTYTIQKQDSV